MQLLALPVRLGAHHRQHDAHAPSLLDETAAGGLCDAGTGTGWTAAAKRGRYRGVAGIVKLVLKPIATIPGRYRVRITGRAGSWRAGVRDLPLAGVVVLDAPTAETGQCATAGFAGTCSASTSGTTLRCR